MSRWITLNIEGIDVDTITEVLVDEKNEHRKWCISIYNDGDKPVVAYTFTSHLEPEQAADLRNDTVAELFDVGAERIVSVSASDTSDHFTARVHKYQEFTDHFTGAFYKPGKRERAAGLTETWDDVATEIDDKYGYRPDPGGNYTND